jgi:hypothetical protein
MFTPTTYPIHCHVCGRDFDLEAEFISGLPGTADGRLRGTCNMSDELPQHTSEEIAASWVATQRER